MKYRELMFPFLDNDIYRGFSHCVCAIQDFQMKMEIFFLIFYLQITLNSRDIHFFFFLQKLLFAICFLNPSQYFIPKSNFFFFLSAVADAIWFKTATFWSNLAPFALLQSSVSTQLQKNILGNIRFLDALTFCTAFRSILGLLSVK